MLARCDTTHHQEAEYTDAVIAFLRRLISCAKAGVHIRIYVSSRTSSPKNGMLANEGVSIYGHSLAASNSNVEA